MYMPQWAISVETGTTAWTYEQRAATITLAIRAGDLVFMEDVNDRCRGLDDETGKVLWEVNLGLPVSGFPSPTWSTAGRSVLGGTARPTASSRSPAPASGGGGRPTWSAWQA